MVRRSLWSAAGLGVVLAWSSGASAATYPFTETFATPASNWLNGASTAPSYVTTGGPDGSAYISYTSALTWVQPTFPGAQPGEPAPAILFRGNNNANASGDAFVGNWLDAGVEVFSVTVRHDAGVPLNFYARIAGAAGAAANIANIYTIPSGTWTQIDLPIVDSNPPFVSYSASTFTGTFSNIQNLQLGLYLPENFSNASVTFDLDNVGLVPEPASLALLGLGTLAAASRGRRRTFCGRM